MVTYLEERVQLAYFGPFAFKLSYLPSRTSSVVCNLQFNIRVPNCVGLIARVALSLQNRSLVEPSESLGTQPILMFEIVPHTSVL